MTRYDYYQDRLDEHVPIAFIVVACLVGVGVLVLSYLLR